MSLHALANHMAAQGRGPDQVLVHMSPRELQGLQSLAVAHGGSLTINPQTGLPEAGFLDSILPVAAGFLLGPAGFGIAETALGAAGIVGGVTTLATGSLSKGLMAGMGAYGGSSLGSSLMGAGTSAIGSAAAAEPYAMGAAMTDAEAQAMGFSSAEEAAQINAANASQSAAGSASMTDKLAAGAKAAAADPLAFAKNNSSALLAAASPMLAGNMVGTSTKMPAYNPGYIRPYDYDPKTMGFTRLEPIKADFSEVPKKPTAAQGATGLAALPSAETATPFSGYATGGIIALADGGDPYAKYNTLSGQSKAAYDYLMGNTSSSGPVVAPRTPVVTPVTKTEPGTTDKPVVTPPPGGSVPPVIDLTPTPDPGHVVEPPSNDHTNPPDTGVEVTPVPDSPNNVVITDPKDTTTHTGTGDGNGANGSSTGGTGTTGTTGGAGGNTAGGIGGTGGQGGAGNDAAGAGAGGGSGSGPAGGTSGGITDLTAGTNGSANTSGGISDLTHAMDTGSNQGGVGIGDSRGVGDGTGSGGLPAGAVDNGDGTYSLDHADGTTGLYAGDGTYLGATGEVSADWQSSATGRTGAGGDGTQGPAVPNVTLTSNTAGIGPGEDGASSITYDYPELLSPADRAAYDAWTQSQQPATPAKTESTGSDTTTQASGWWDDPLGTGSVGGGGGGGRSELALNDGYGFDGGGGGGGGCPAPWINILLADGGTVQAGDMKPGMQVFTRHEKTDEWGVYPVTAVSFGEDERWEVVLEDGRTFLGTFNHRVCAIDKDWIEIRDLQPGDKLVQPEGVGVVKSSTQKDRGTIVKITVADAHTYISEGFLSHNIKNEGLGDSYMMMANGGMTPGYALGGLGALGGYSDGGQLLKGPGDGVSDSIPASIGDRQPARLADGEFVVPARIVSELGNGSTEAGARQLYAMMDRIQKNRKKSIGKGNVAVDSRANKHLPA